MNIYKLSQTINDNYDTFDSCVVIAENKKEAVKAHPNGYQNWDTRGQKSESRYYGYENFDIYGYENFDINDWAEIKDIKVELIGVADESLDTEIKVVCASFNAG